MCRGVDESERGVRERERAKINIFSGPNIQTKKSELTCRINQPSVE